MAEIESRRDALERRRREDSESVIRAWLAALPGDEWAGGASAFAEELSVIDELHWPGRLQSKAWIVPRAVGVVRFLEIVDEAIHRSGWEWRSRRVPAGREIAFVRGETS